MTDTWFHFDTEKRQVVLCEDVSLCFLVHYPRQEEAAALARLSAAVYPDLADGTQGSPEDYALAGVEALKLLLHNFKRLDTAGVSAAYSLLDPEGGKLHGMLTPAEAQTLQDKSLTVWKRTLIDEQVSTEVTEGAKQLILEHALTVGISDDKEDEFSPWSVGYDYQADIEFVEGELKASKTVTSFPYLKLVSGISPDQWDDARKALKYYREMSPEERTESRRLHQALRYRWRKWLAYNASAGNLFVENIHNRIFDDTAQHIIKPGTAEFVEAYKRTAVYYAQLIRLI